MWVTSSWWHVLMSPPEATGTNPLILCGMVMVTMARYWHVPMPPPLASRQPPEAGCGAREVVTARPPVASSHNQRPQASVRDQQQCPEDIGDSADIEWHPPETHHHHHHHCHRDHFMLLGATSWLELSSLLYWETWLYGSESEFWACLSCSKLNSECSNMGWKSKAFVEWSVRSCSELFCKYCL